MYCMKCNAHGADNRCRSLKTSGVVTSSTRGAIGVYRCNNEAVFGHVLVTLAVVEFYLSGGIR